VQCPVCGRYEITGTGVDLIAHWTLAENCRLAMAFAVRRMTDRPDAPRITSDVLKALKSFLGHTAISKCGNLGCK
jgi:hypothetical protein